MRVTQQSNARGRHSRLGLTAVPYLLLGLLASMAAHAFTFIPTDTEFNGWPGYCRAVYAKTNVGSMTRFATRVHPGDQAALALIEGSGIYGPHHSCAGMIWLNRARQEQRSQQREYMLNQAVAETMFAYVRSRKQSPYFAEIAIQLAVAHIELGNSDEAMTTLSQLISAQPRNPIAYSAMAIQQRKAGDLNTAIATLLSGDDAVEGQSAEIKYNLGLMMLEAGRIEQAAGYADAAYSLGYPLPGLRAKLEKAQHNLAANR